MRRLLILLSATLVSVIGLSAQTAGWQLDKSHSRVSFSVKHMLISEVSGNFREFDIALSSVKDDYSDAAVEATINVASINTENERRDNHLKSDDFFSAEKFAEIKFKSTSIEKVGENRFKIHGHLTIRDSTKSVSFDAENTGTLKTSRGTLAGWKATISVNRFDYGLKWDRTVETGGLVAGDTIYITLTLEYRKPNS